MKKLLSKIEIEFLKSPESFNANYAYGIKHRLNCKVKTLREELELLKKSGFLNLTGNSNNLTDFNKIPPNNQGQNRVAFIESRWWAEPDSDRRPLARKANVLTRLDDRPTELFDKMTA